MVATYASIASSFQRSAEGPWLLTMYTFGYIVALPVVCFRLCHLLVDSAFERTLRVRALDLEE